MNRIFVACVISNQDVIRFRLQKVWIARPIIYLCVFSMLAMKLALATNESDNLFQKWLKYNFHHQYFRHNVLRCGENDICWRRFRVSTITILLWRRTLFVKKINKRISVKSGVVPIFEETTLLIWPHINSVFK